MDEDEMEDLLDELVEILEPVADGNASPRDLNKAVASAYELVDSALAEIRVTEDDPYEEGDDDEPGGADEDGEDEEDEEDTEEVVEREL